MGSTQWFWATKSKGGPKASWKGIPLFLDWSNDLQLYDEAEAILQTSNPPKKTNSRFKASERYTEIHAKKKGPQTEVFRFLEQFWLLEINFVWPMVHSYQKRLHKRWLFQSLGGSLAMWIYTRNTYTIYYTCMYCMYVYIYTTYSFSFRRAPTVLHHIFRNFCSFSLSTAKIMISFPSSQMLGKYGKFLHPSLWHLPVLQGVLEEGIHPKKLLGIFEFWWLEVPKTWSKIQLWSWTTSFGKKLKGEYNFVFECTSDQCTKYTYLYIMYI